MIATIVDAGPLVAYYDSRDQQHPWAHARISSIRPPMLTSEPVLGEASYLIQSGGGNPEVFLQLVQRGVLSVGLHLEDEAAALERLMRRYKDLPMSLADASLVRLSEIQRNSRVLTLDTHFKIYRRFERQVIPLIAPWA